MKTIGAFALSIEKAAKDIKFAYPDFNANTTP